MRILAALALLALASCAPAAAAVRPIRPFSSDGCTLFPDGTPGDPRRWCDCCFRHDVAYWRGGTRAEREAADEALRVCVLTRTGDRGLADLVYQGVRVGGSPAFPNWYRWAYGWPFGRGYEPLSRAEAEQASAALRRYLREHPGGYCGRR